MDDNVIIKGPSSVKRLIHSLVTQDKPYEGTAAATKYAEDPWLQPQSWDLGSRLALRT